MADALTVSRSNSNGSTVDTSTLVGFGMQHSVYINEECMPIAPAKITITIANKNKTVDLAAGGVYKVLNMPGLTSYEFELIIPHDKDSLPFAVYQDGFQPPQHYFDLFEKLKTASDLNERAFPFVVVDNSSEPTLISTIVTLEDYEITQDADEDVLDYRINVKLEKYERHVTQSFTLVENGDGTWTAIDDGMHDRLQAAADAMNAAQNAIKMAQGAAALSQSMKTKKSTTVSAAAIELSKSGNVSVADIKNIASANGISPCDTLPAGTVIRK